MNRSSLRVANVLAPRTGRLPGVVALAVVVSLVSASVVSASSPQTAALSRANVQATGPSNYDETFEGTATIEVDVDGESDGGACQTTGSGTFTVDLAGDLSVYEGQSRFSIDSDTTATFGVPRGQYSSHKVCDYFGTANDSTEDVQTTGPDCASGCNGTVELLDTHTYETVNDDGSVPYDWGVDFDVPYFTTNTVTDQSGTITFPGYRYFTEIFPLPVVKGALAAVGSAVITAIVTEPILVAGVAAIAVITIALHAISKRCKEPAVVQVNLTLSAPDTQLLDTERLSARLTAKPCKIRSYTFEWSRTGLQPHWVVLKTIDTTSSTASYSFKPKIAGTMYVRVRVTSSYQPTPGVSVISSPPEGMKVRFPTVNEILNSARVKSIATLLWKQTIDGTSEHQRSEYCTLIRLNTRDGNYRATPFVPGRPVYEGFPGECPRAEPHDNPARPGLNDSPTYTVATMHSHTVYRYLTKGRTRPVGPSDTDRHNATNRGIPTIVIDYVGTGGRIHGGWPIHAPTHNYTAGPLARKPIFLT